MKENCQKCRNCQRLKIESPAPEEILRLGTGFGFNLDFLAILAIPTIGKFLKFFSVLLKRFRSLPHIHSNGEPLGDAETPPGSFRFRVSCFLYLGGGSRGCKSREGLFLTYRAAHTGQRTVVIENWRPARKQHGREVARDRLFREAFRTWFRDLLPAVPE